MESSDSIFEILHNSDSDELIKIVINKREEFSEEVIEFSKQILTERNVDWRQISTEKFLEPKEKTGDLEIKQIKRRAKFHMISGLVGLFGGAALLIIGGLFMTFFIGFGIWHITSSVRLTKRANRLVSNKMSISEVNIPPEQLVIIRELNKAIKTATNGDSKELRVFLEKFVTKESIDQIDNFYEVEFFENFLDQIRNISNSYEKIELMLRPLINKGILDSKYPHHKIKT